MIGATCVVHSSIPKIQTNRLSEIEKYFDKRAFELRIYSGIYCTNYNSTRITKIVGVGWEWGKEEYIFYTIVKYLEQIGKSGIV